MPSITFTAPDGTSSTGQMSDDDYSKFKALPADQQTSTLNSFAEQHAAADKADNSYTNDLKAGVGGAMQDLGGLAQGAGLTSAGNWLRQNAPQPDAAYTGRGGQFLPDLKAGQFSRAAGDLGHGLASGSAESALEAGGAIGGGALGTLIGPEGTAAGAIGGGVGAGLIGGALGLGRHARLAAGQRAVTGSDLANAAPAAAVDAGISGLTMGRVPGGTLGRMAAQGLGGAAQSASDQYADTGSVDPNQVANSAASGAAFGGLTGGAADTGRIAGRAADNIQSRGEAYQPVNDQQAVTFARTRNAITDAQKQPDAPADLNKVANNLKSAWITDAENRIAQMKAQGADAAALRDAQDLLNRAQRHNNVLYASDLDGLEQANHGLDAGQLQDFKDRLADLNTIATNSFKNKNVGPISSVLQTVGKYAAPVYELTQGNIPGAMTAALLGHGFSGPIGKIAGGVGSRLDAALGLQKNKIMLQGQAADRMLDSQPAPVNPITSTNYVPMAKPLPAPPIQKAAPPPVSVPLPAPPIQKAAPPLAGVPLAPPPIQKAAQAPVSVPLPAPPIQRAAPVDPLAANGVAPKPPLAAPPVAPARGTAETAQAALPAGPMDTHGRLINDPAAHQAAVQAYRSNAMMAAMQADGEAPGAGLGQIITDIMDTHHHGFADASLPTEAKAAIRADTRAKTIAMKQGKAQAAMALVAPEHQHILAKYLTPALLRHG